MQGLTRTTTLSLTLFSTPLWADVHSVAPGQSIQDAVDAASNGDVIELGTGIFIESVSTVGKELTFRGQAANSTIWEAEPNGGCLQASYADITVEALTMTKGTGFGSFVQVGGAILANQCLLHVERCTFLDNESSSGGAVMLNYTFADFYDCDFEGNRVLHAGSYGGCAIKTVESMLRIDRSRFIDNGWGTTIKAQGVLHASGSQLEVNNSVFRGNAVNYGSLAYLTGTDAIITHTTCLDNLAYTSGSVLWANNGSTVQLGNSVVQNNVGPLYDEPFRYFDGASLSSAGNISDVLIPAGTFDTWGATNLHPVVLDFEGDYDTPEIVGYPADNPSVTLGSFTSPTLDTSVDIHQEPRVVYAAGAVESTDVQANCSADLVANGRVDMDDLLVVLQSWGNCDGACPGDANEDGFTDWLDLLSVITAWGECP